MIRPNLQITLLQNVHVMQFMAGDSECNRPDSHFIIVGDAAPAPVISTFAKTAWCTTAPNSEDIPAFLWLTTPSKTFGANFAQKKAARLTALSPAFIKRL